MGVLVGVDLPAGGHEWLVGRAGDYARRMSTTVDVVYFVPSQTDDPSFLPRLQAYLDLLDEPLRGTPRVVMQTPADGLVDLSGAYDLLVLGSREPPALERLIKGPMAGRVLRRSHCAVLVPRSEAWRMPETTPRLLVGVDVRGPDPERVLRMGAEWAARVGGKLDGLYVESGHLPHIANRQLREAAEKQWYARRQPQVDRLNALMHAWIPDAQRGDALLRRGEPEDVLVSLSADYDLVLVGNRDREGLARLVLGAVAPAVVRRAGCDVISLPTADMDVAPVS